LGEKLAGEKSGRRNRDVYTEIAFQMTRRARERKALEIDDSREAPELEIPVAKARLSGGVCEIGRIHGRCETGELLPRLKTPVLASQCDVIGRLEQSDQTHVIVLGFVYIFSV